MPPPSKNKKKFFASFNALFQKKIKPSSVRGRLYDGGIHEAIPPLCFDPDSGPCGALGDKRVG